MNRPIVIYVRNIRQPKTDGGSAYGEENCSGRAYQRGHDTCISGEQMFIWQEKSDMMRWVK